MSATRQVNGWDRERSYVGDHVSAARYVQGSPVFWGEIPPCEHLLQFYENKGAFLSRLAGFVRGGIEAGEGVIAIMTPGHRRELAHRLATEGVDLAAAERRGQFFPLDAAETLAGFLTEEQGSAWPDEARFERLVDGLLERASKGPHGKGRRVRAFGEMVAILWQQGSAAATVRLEELWHQFCQTKAFCLFCAYPRAGFTRADAEMMRAICESHSALIDG